MKLIPMTDFVLSKAKELNDAPYTEDWKEDYIDFKIEVENYANFLKWAF